MMTEMKCDEASSHLPLFVGGDLEAPLGESLSAHLEACDPCSQRLEALERARAALISTRRTEPADGSGVDLWAGIRSQLSSDGLLDSGPRPAVSSPLRSVGFGRGFQRRLGGVAAAAALALLVWSPWNEGGAPGEPKPAGALAESTTSPSAGELVAESAPIAVQPVSTAPTGGLRRLLPGEQPLSETAQPFRTLLPAGEHQRTGSGWSLVGEKRLR